MHTIEMLFDHLILQDLFTLHILHLKKTLFQLTPAWLKLDTPSSSAASHVWLLPGAPFPPGFHGSKALPAAALLEPPALLTARP